MDIVTELYRNLAETTSLFDAEQLILQGVMALGQEIMRNFLEDLDQVLLDEVPDDYQVISKQERTITFSFGPVTFKRRYYQTGDHHKQFYLDRKLAIKPRRRLSPHYRMMMAKIGQTTTMRNTAAVLNLLFDSGITADSVMHAVHELGELVSSQTRVAEQCPVARRIPTKLTVEGDAFMIKLKPGKKKPARPIEVHHYRLYEHIGKRVVNRHDFLSLGHLNQLRTRVSDYLDRHYKLNHQTIFLASDAGPGYEPQTLLDLVPVNAKGEYFLDHYHCLQKIETTLGRFNELTPKAIKAIWKQDQDQLTVILDTYESTCTTEKQLENLSRLRSYLTRNWNYLSTPRQRGYSNGKLIGSIESSHRACTYRMKKQGKSWTERGARSMLGLIEARINGELQNELEQVLRRQTALPQMSSEVFLQELHSQTRDFLRMAPPQPSLGVIKGQIINNAPTSSPIGHLRKLFTH